jgi:hypothetical protein
MTAPKFKTQHVTFNYCDFFSDAVKDMDFLCSYHRLLHGSSACLHTGLKHGGELQNINNMPVFTDSDRLTVKATSHFTDRC